MAKQKAWAFFMDKTSDVPENGINGESRVANQPASQPAISQPVSPTESRRRPSIFN
jgi:hypothetical protein